LYLNWMFLSFFVIREATTVPTAAARTRTPAQTNTLGEKAK